MFMLRKYARTRQHPDFMMRLRFHVHYSKLPKHVSGVHFCPV